MQEFWHNFYKKHETFFCQQLVLRVWAFQGEGFKEWLNTEDYFVELMMKEHTCCLLFLVVLTVLLTCYNLAFPRLG